MKPVIFREIEGSSPGFWILLGMLGAITMVGLGAAWYMEHNGHWVTGMDNQVVWGMPHVFAVYLIIAASGVLNIASLSSVFGKKVYKPLAPLSGLLSITLLIGGLLVLVLDLGRPDRLIVAMTHLNAKSVFAWNQILYNGFLVIMVIYLWTMMEKRLSKYSKVSGMVAFVWRFILTTGTGSIFGFLVAREGYDTAILAPMFIIMSLAAGLSIYILVLMAAYRWSGRPLGDGILRRLKNLLGIFVSTVLYFVLVFHLTSLYATEHHGIEAFILLGENGGERYSAVFWWLQIVLGSIVPLVIVFTNLSRQRLMIVIASVLVILGGLAQMYVIIIGGQAYPLEIFPGMEVVQSGFMDHVVTQYSPSLPEFLLGFGVGVGVAMMLVVIGVRVLRFLPESLADEVIEAHDVAKPSEAVA